MSPLASADYRRTCSLQVFVDYIANTLRSLVFCQGVVLLIDQVLMTEQCQRGRP